MRALTEGDIATSPPVNRQAAYSTVSVTSMLLRVALE